MVSDVVLSKELPEFINDSIDAYIGCISGAITKDKYIDTVRSAGFQDINIIGEVTIPVEEWVNDPIASSITEKLQISAEEAREILNSVISIKVKAFKK
jgi:hypothetical protein